MPQEVRIDPPPERVWEIVADFGGVARYHLGLCGSRSTSAANSGVGATRHCDLRPLERVAPPAVPAD